MLENVIPIHHRTHNCTMVWKINKDDVKGSRYNRELKIQGDAAIDHELFDPTNDLSF